MNFDSAGVEEPGPSNAVSSIVIHPSPAQTMGESSADDTCKVNCDCLGFTSFTVPNQPVDVSESKKTYSYQNKEKIQMIQKFILGEYNLTGVPNSHR